MAASIQKQAYGTTADGISVEQYTLTNANGMEAVFITFGGIMTSLRVPDRHGNWANVVLGLSSLADYETKNVPYLGAVIGRHGKRIANAQFTLEGKTYTLAANNGPNSLHGGIKGFNKVVWAAREVYDGENVGIAFSYLSPDGEEGFPGNLNVEIVFTVTADNALRLDYTASTDQLTVLNLSNHAYFNLSGNGAGTIYENIVQINADHYTPIDENLIPTGEIAPVAGTPFDFRAPMQVGAHIRSGDTQMVYGRGYDHNYALNRADTTSLEYAARVYDPASGRIMEVLTTELGIQLYTGNFLDGTLVGSSGGLYRQGDALCLETQHFPDAPNQPTFTSSALAAGETYRSATVYKFTTD